MTIKPPNGSADEHRFKYLPPPLSEEHAKVFKRYQTESLAPSELSFAKYLRLLNKLPGSVLPSFVKRNPGMTYFEYVHSMGGGDGPDEHAFLIRLGGRQDASGRYLRSATGVAVAKPDPDVPISRGDFLSYALHDFYGLLAPLFSMSSETVDRESNLEPDGIGWNKAPQQVEQGSPASTINCETGLFVYGASKRRNTPKDDRTITISPDEYGDSLTTSHILPDDVTTTMSFHPVNGKVEGLIWSDEPGKVSIDKQKYDLQALFKSFNRIQKKGLTMTKYAVQGPVYGGLNNLEQLDVIIKHYASIYEQLARRQIPDLNRALSRSTDYKFDRKLD